MVMTIVPFNKHGRPWSDHGQLMVISWSTMVNDHDPAARVSLITQKRRGETLRLIAFDKMLDDMGKSEINWLQM